MSEEGDDIETVEGSNRVKKNKKNENERTVNIDEDKQDWISTDDDLCCTGIDKIGNSVFDENNENEDSIFFNKFALGANLKDKPKDIINNFTKLVKFIMKNLFFKDKCQLKDRQVEQSLSKNASKRKWNNILTIKSSKLGKNKKDDLEAQGLEKLMVLNAFKINELNVEEVKNESSDEISWWENKIIHGSKYRIHKQKDIIIIKYTAGNDEDYISIDCFDNLLWKHCKLWLERFSRSTKLKQLEELTGI